MLYLLCEAPDGQLDKQITDLLKTLIDKPIEEQKIGVMRAIDMCVNGGLSSEFGLKVLHSYHENFLGGKSSDFNDINCPWRVTDR